MRTSELKGGGDVTIPFPFRTVAAVRPASLTLVSFLCSYAHGRYALNRRACTIRIT